MQSVNPGVSLPYWDFTIEGAYNLSVWESPIFTADTFGSLALPGDEFMGWSYKVLTLLSTATIRCLVLNASSPLPHNIVPLTRTERYCGGCPDIGWTMGRFKIGTEHPVPCSQLRLRLHARPMEHEPQHQAYSLHIHQQRPAHLQSTLRAAEPNQAVGIPRQSTLRAARQYGMLVICFFIYIFRFLRDLIILFLINSMLQLAASLAVMPWTACARPAT